MRCVWMHLVHASFRFISTACAHTTVCMHAAGCARKAARFDSWFAHSRNVACRRPDWEQKYGLCWAGARDNFEHCYASASASASFQKEQQKHCKDLFLNHVQSCA